MEITKKEIELIDITKARNNSINESTVENKPTTKKISKKGLIAKGAALVLAGAIIGGATNNVTNTLVHSYKVNAVEKDMLDGYYTDIIKPNTFGAPNYYFDNDNMARMVNDLNQDEQRAAIYTIATSYVGELEDELAISNLDDVIRNLDNFDCPNSKTFFSLYGYKNYNDYQKGEKEYLKTLAEKKLAEKDVAKKDSELEKMQEKEDTFNIANNSKLGGK